MLGPPAYVVAHIKYVLEQAPESEHGYALSYPRFRHLLEQRSPRLRVIGKRKCLSDAVAKGCNHPIPEIGRRSPWPLALVLSAPIKTFQLKLIGQTSEVVLKWVGNPVFSRDVPKANPIGPAPTMTISLIMHNYA